MEIQALDDQILIKQTQLRVEKDTNKRQDLNKQLKVLQLKKEIAVIQRKISQMH